MLALVLFLDTLILLILIVKDSVFDLESCHEACVVPEEGTLRADNGVDLTHRLHDLELVVVQLGWHQIHVPHREVGVEKDNCFHRQLGQIRVILHEIRVKCGKRLRGVRKRRVGIGLDELTNIKVAEDEIFQDQEQARDKTEDK